MKIRLLTVIGGFAIGLILGTWILRAQTQLSLNSQVSPAPSQILTSLYQNVYSTPTASGIGLLYATLKNTSTGVLTPYVLVPPGTNFVFNAAQWQSIPLSLPKGTGVTCSQVKP